MCMIVKEGCKPEIAKEDIVCYKIVGYSSDETEWRAIFRDTFHKYDTVLDIHNPLSVKTWTEARGANRLNIGWMYIEEGFHAYSTLRQVNFEYDRRDIPGELIAKCTIPKGAMYCYGTNDRIVANKMIVHKPKDE